MKRIISTILLVAVLVTMPNLLTPFGVLAQGIGVEQQPVESFQAYGDTLTGAVQDTSGNPVNNVSVSIFDVTDMELLGISYTAYNGAWSISNVQPGHDYSIRYYHPQYLCTPSVQMIEASVGNTALPNVIATKLLESSPTETDASLFMYQVLSDSYGEYAEITGYKGTDPHVVIPKTIDGYSVQSIGANAFDRNSSITSVVFPEDLTIIGYQSFSYCTALEQVVFPYTLSEIEQRAFQNCTALEEISFPNELTYIGSRAFAGTKIQKVSFPESLQTLENEAFMNCARLEEVEYPVGLTYAGSKTFYNCPNFKQVTIPEGVTVLAQMAFSGANFLETVTFPDSLQTISYGAFQDCTSLQNPVFPEALECVEDRAFAGCTSLTEVSLPDTVTTILDEAFADCTNLETFRYPLAWNRAENYIFENCPNLLSIQVPEGVVSLPDKVFYGANHLGTVSLPSTLTSISNYAFNMCAGLTEITIPKKVESIGPYAFYGCENLKTVSFSEGLLSIGSDAFAECTSLEELLLPDSVESIGRAAFDACSGLRSFHYPKNLKSVGQYLFANCTSLQTIAVTEGVTALPQNIFFEANCLETVVLPSTLQTIGNNAFRGAIKLKTVSLPSGVQSIGTYAFYNCTSLPSVTLPEGITTIPNYAFYGCTNLAEVNIRGNLTEIGNYVFFNCSSLAGMELPSTLQTLRNNAFENCTNLATLSFPPSVTTVGQNVWKGCSRLLTVSFQAGIQKIPANAFYQATSLKKISLPDSVTSIGNNAFYGCTGLQKIRIGSGVTEIASNSFSGCTSLMIHGVEGSYAQTYAQNNSIPFSTDDIDAVGNGLFGTVCDANQTPVAGYSVLVFDKTKNKKIGVYETNEEGYWNCEDVTKDGTYLLRYYHPRYQMTEPVVEASVESISLKPLDLVAEKRDLPTTTSAESYFSYTVINGNEAEITAYNGNEETVVIPDTLQGYPVTAIATGAFRSNTKIKRVILPQNLKSIPLFGFGDCPALEEVVFNTALESISYYAFQNDTSLQNLVLPNHIEKIEMRTFYQSSLRSIDLPDGITEIGEQAFSGCTSLTSWTYPRGLVTVGNEILRNCTALTEMVIPHGVTTLPAKVFSKANGLEKVTLPSTLTTLSKEAFSECSNLHEISFAQGLISIGNSAFKNCISLTSLALPDSVETIGGYAFSGCAKLNTINIPASLETVNGYVFDGCTGLRNVTFPATMTTLPGYLFYGAGLKAFRVPDHITAIGEAAFWNCDTLKKIWIGPAVTSIGTEALYDCENATIYGEAGSYAQTYAQANNIPFLTEGFTLDATGLEGVVTDASGNAVPNVSVLIYNKTKNQKEEIVTTEEDGSWVWDGAKGEDTYLLRYYHPAYEIPMAETTYEPDVILSATAKKVYTLPQATDASPFRYSTLSNGGIKITGYTGTDTTVSIPATIDGYSVTEIARAAFSGNSTIKTLVIPDTVTTISANAFYGCSNLEQVHFGIGVKTIGDSAFSNCLKLKHLRMPNTLESIGESAFAYNSALQTIDLPDSFQTLSRYAFRDCIALTGFTAPRGLSSAEGSTFTGCTSLTDLVLPEGMQTVPDYAFSFTPALKRITWPSTLTKIGVQAFAVCNQLETLTLPEGLKEIDAQAFSECPALTSVTLPETIESLGAGAFSSCTALPSIYLPDSLKRMGNWVFASCTSLAEVNYPMGLLEADFGIFENCPLLKEFTVPEGVTALPRSLFASCDFEKIHLPNSLQTIGDSAFSNCQNLTEIVLPSGVQSIGDSCFYGCENLETVRFPDQLQHIGDSAFQDCSLLQAADLKDNVTSIGSRAFENCTALSRFTYPKQLAETGQGVFQNCENLKTLVVPEGVEVLPNCAFSGANYVETISLPESLLEIGFLAFDGCSQLRNITLPKSTKTIGDAAFQGADRVTVYCSEEMPALLDLVKTGVQIAFTEEKQTFAHLDGSYTQYSTTQDSMTGHVSYEIRYRLKEDCRATDLQVVIQLPANTECLLPSIRVNGRALQNEDFVYDEWQNILTLPVAEREGIILFSVVPNEYTNMTTCAQLLFRENGIEDSEILGAINTSRALLTLETRERASSRNIPVTGLTLPSTNVKLYLNDQLYQIVRSQRNGRYNANILLDDPKNFEKFVLTAKVENGGETHTATAPVLYETSAPVLEDFKMTRNGAERYNLLQIQQPLNITWAPGDSYTFTASFENEELLRDVYIVSTTGTKKEYLPTVYNERTHQYEGQGHFSWEGEATTLPGSISVEYSKKPKEVSLTEPVDQETLLSYMDDSVQDFQTTVTKSTDTELEATIQPTDEVAELLGDEIKVAVKTIDKNYNNIPIMDLFTTTKDIYSYFFDKDGSKYVMNLDFSHEDINMVIHDISSNKQLTYIISAWDMPKPGEVTKASKLVDWLGKVSSVTGTLADVYDIQSSDEDLRKKIMAKGMTSEERAIALEKAEELKRDREMFLLTTMIISTVTMGTVGAPALVFGLLFGAVTASSDFFWERRMAGILGEDIRTRWRIDPSGYVYDKRTEERLSGVTTTAYWIEYDPDNEEFWNTYPAEDEYGTLWDATEWDQQNPLTTDMHGCYAWDVPQGFWRVKYEKPFYETTWSDWMPVPPEQKEVNIGLEPLRYLQYENQTVTIQCEEAYEDAVVWLAAYKEDGSLLHATSRPVDIQNGQTTVSFSDFVTTGAAWIKVLAWDGANSLSPLFYPCKVSLP